MASKIFKANIRYIRSVIGVTQEGMADVWGIPVKRYMSYEEGRGEPDLNSTALLCGVLGINANDLIVENMAEKYPKETLSQRMLKSLVGAKKAAK